jgi:hypothetical protein
MKNRILMINLILLFLSAFISCVFWYPEPDFSGDDMSYSIIETADGGYIIAGYSNSDDILPTNGEYGEVYDFYVVKLDAQGELLWDSMYDEGGGDIARDLIQTDDEGFMVIGETQALNPDLPEDIDQGENYLMMKLDKDGVKNWSKIYGGVVFDFPHSIIQTLDGGYLTVGETYSYDIVPDNGINYTGELDPFGVPNQDYYILKTDDEGNEEWVSMYGGLNYDYGMDAVQNSDGTYVVIGYSNSAGGEITPDIGSFNGDRDIYIVKLDSNGASIWEAVYGGSGAEAVYDIEKTTDGGYIITGSTWSSDIADNTTVGEFAGYGDFYILKIASDGTKQWDAIYGGANGYDEAYSVYPTNDGGYIVAGETLSNDLVPTTGENHATEYMPDIYVIKIDSNGVKEWDAIYGGRYSDTAYGVIQSSDGDYIITGSSESDDIQVDNGVNRAVEGFADFYILKLNPDGTKEWDAMYGGESPL